MIKKQLRDTKPGLLVMDASSLFKMAISDSTVLNATTFHSAKDVTKRTASILISLSE